MSRENSSLHHNLPSLKEDVNDTQLSAKAKSLERIAEISGSNTIDNFAQMDLDQIGVDTIDPATTPQVLSASEFEKPPEIGSFGFMKGRKEDSVQSLTPIEIAEEFSRTIDFEFATSRNLRELSIANSGSQEPLDIAEEIVSEESERSVSEIRTSRNGRIRQENLIRERPDSLIITSGLNISSITLTSSEDEFFSPDEFAPSVIQGLTNSFAKCAPSPTISSDGTIINDHIHDDATVSFDTTGGHQKSGVITEDSMAQLSEFLNGTINFGEFSLES
ncbi:hypothetical protein G9P44_006324 [Scheffersomyces stipitis]|nr:hypothetical protein G9P44_006324 [Scheffersomyces stipitis]